MQVTPPKIEPLATLNRALRVMVFAAVGSILGVITGFWLNPSASIDELTVFVAAPLVFAYVLLRFLVVVSSRIPDAPEGAPVPPMPAMFVMVLTLIFASALGSVIVGALSMEAYHLLDVEWAYIAARVFIADCGWVAAVCAVLLCIHLICRDLLPVLDRALSSIFNLRLPSDRHHHKPA
jgi:hypothetical protein